MTGLTPVATLPFVGPKYAQLLKNLGIESLRDLLYHLPSRYLDLSKITTVEELLVGETQVVEAEVQTVKKVRLSGSRSMTTVTVGDTTGTITLTWFNQPFIEKALHPGQVFRFAGEVSEKSGIFQMTNATFELASAKKVHTGRLVPVYPLTAGITAKWLRARIAPILSKIPDICPDFLPGQLLERQQLLPLATALHQIHAPESISEAASGRRRLAFDELLLLQLAALQRKDQWQNQSPAAALVLDEAALALLISQLPFTLTDAQTNVLHAILSDLSQTQAMNRLLEGDVGSGKTVVALLASLVAHQNCYQTAVMAPTAVLAQQHYLTFQKLLSEILHSSVPTPSISLRTAKSKMATADITIGTHALLSEGVNFERLGLVIIDEQHRFGVEQRATLMAKAGRGVHLLAMTATPIPRTMALTMYGDLDLSVIDEMPEGRIPIKTHIVPEHKRLDCYVFVRQAIEQHKQAFIVCPLVEDSETLESVRSATGEFDRLQQKIFAGERLALLHGRMKPSEKDQVLADFKAHKYDILVTTPVVEVGIDVPNATIMLIEGAERFGLAQLHQLRGRVGRGQDQSYCLLFSDATDPFELRRLQYLTQESSGIRLAQLDLDTRGPGEVYGTRQSGIASLKAADLSDTDLIEAAHQEAIVMANTRQLYEPDLEARLKANQPRVELN
jgi:ATP-dependent DNA helicase RecG